MADKTYGDWIRSNPPLPTKEYKHMAQETAVEWLENNMPDISHYIPMKVLLEVDAKFQVAERMHKEQIIGTYVHLKMKNNKLPYGMKYVMKLQKIEDEAERYYNETFKK